VPILSAACECGPVRRCQLDATFRRSGDLLARMKVNPHAATLALGALVLVGCGGSPDATDPGSQVSTPPSTGLLSMPNWEPGDSSDSVPIDAGTYLVPRSPWSVADYTVTLPADWTVQYGHVLAQHTGEQNEFGFYEVVVEEIYADACDGENGEVVRPGPGTQDLVDALLAQPGPTKRGPVEATVGDRPAVRIDLSTPRRLDEMDCFLGPGTGVQIWYAEPADKYFVLLPDAVTSVYVVDVDGARQVFVAQVGDPTSTADRAELDTVLASIRFKDET